MWSEFQGAGVSVRMTSPLIVMPLAIASFRAAVASRPLLLSPSPERR